MVQEVMAVYELGYIVKAAAVAVTVCSVFGAKD
jgi:hypothetical protein